MPDISFKGLLVVRAFESKSRRITDVKFNLELISKDTQVSE